MAKTLKVFLVKILTIGPDVVDEDCTRQITKTWGHQLEKAKTGEEALKNWLDKDFDLILLNVLLPDGKGYELIPEVRRKWPNCQIIAVTDENSRQLESKVRKEGVAYYMIRPFDNGNLESIIVHLSQNQEILRNPE